jgi:REP element-mobilizing transposase RayT
MPRKPRIEYENAFYHVMNRGRGREMIFHGEEYYQIFVDLLEDVHERFGCIIHCYCLMGNHYHLLLETPYANLSRIMRHINGVYTQSYNRLKNTDGSLFRGRFKSILVEKDAYIMQLSRYIHRNPIEMKKPLVSDLADYKWSSYRAYIGKDKNNSWLNRQFTYDILGHKQKYKAYATFVNQGVDEETQKFYSGKQIPSVIGEISFKQWIFDKILTDKDAEIKSNAIANNLELMDVINVVSRFYNKDVSFILDLNKGPQIENEARKVAMYLCQQLTNKYLIDIAKLFNLTSTSSVSYTTHMIRKRKRENKKFAKKIDGLIKSIASKMT